MRLWKKLRKKRMVWMTDSRLVKEATVEAAWYDLWRWYEPLLTGRCIARGSAVVDSSSS